MMVPINFRVTEEMRKQIKIAANRKFESQQKLIVRAIAKEIARVEKEAK